MQRTHANPTALTTLALASVLGCVLLGAGCYDSLTSIVTDDKAVFYEDLVGDYQTGKENARQKVTIARGEGKAYTYQQFKAGGEVEYSGTFQVIKLGEEHFYEMTIDGHETAGGKPVYVVGRLVMEGEAGKKTIVGYMFKSKDSFFNDAEVTTAEFEYEQQGQKKSGRALNMPAEKLQAYFEEHAGEMTEEALRLEQTAAATTP